jgi:hypothetical protein
VFGQRVAVHDFAYSCIVASSVPRISAARESGIFFFSIALRTRRLNLHAGVHIAAGDGTRMPLLLRRTPPAGA